jgi:N-acetylglucosaminyldiphosphoundecaprenol N-acetyl-beta-D-mannosaminyltransferase
LLGAADGVAEKAASVLKQRNPSLQVVGAYAGSPKAADEDTIAEMVAASGADILFVAYGVAQEHWIARNLPRLNVGVALGVGGAFDFIAGVTQRAPDWMCRAGLEWLHRLIMQPWRLRRMLRLPLFVFEVLRRGQAAPRAFGGGKP